MIMIRGIALILSLALLSGAAVVAFDQPLDRKPVLVIWENPHYPGYNDDDFMGGLIAVVWADGRIIRAADMKAVGHSYVEGHANEKQFKELVSFLMSKNVAPTPDIFSVPVDASSTTFVLWAYDKKHVWTWGMPEKHPMLDDILNFTWQLTLERSEPLKAKKEELEQFNPNHAK